MGRKRDDLAGRYLAAFLASLTLAAQILSLSHEGLVRHVVCAEHGEVVHADRVDSPAGTSSKALERAATERSAAVRGELGANEAHGHEHCLIAAHRRERTVLSMSGAFTNVSGPERETAAARPEVLRPAAIAIYRVAPKTPPPAASLT